VFTLGVHLDGAGLAVLTRDSRQFLPTPAAPRMRILIVGLRSDRRMFGGAISTLRFQQSVKWPSTGGSPVTDAERWQSAKVIEDGLI
jgi:hypothetical protein